MRGVFSKLPADTLAAALAPIADRCAVLEWAVNTQSGPLNYPYWVEDEPGNLVAWHHVERDFDRSRQTMDWFSRGFLPRYADCLIMDEWSYYLGFDAEALCPLDLARLIGSPMHPGGMPMDVIARHRMIYLMRVDSGWWEAYCADAEILQRLLEGWDGIETDSDRWSNTGIIATYPPDDAGT